MQPRLMKLSLSFAEAPLYRCRSRGSQLVLLRSGNISTAKDVTNSVVSRDSNEGHCSILGTVAAPESMCCSGLDKRGESSCWLPCCGNAPEGMAATQLDKKRDERYRSIDYLVISALQYHTYALLCSSSSAKVVGHGIVPMYRAIVCGVYYKDCTHAHLAMGNSEGPSSLYPVQLS